MESIHINSFSDQEIHNSLNKHFSHEEIESIKSLINMYNLKDRPRLIMACIKLSKGDYNELNSYLFHASDYCMEFIAKAESHEDYSTWIESSIA
jgi:hypothetical protein